MLEVNRQSPSDGTSIFSCDMKQGHFPDSPHEYLLINIFCFWKVTTMKLVSIGMQEDIAHEQMEGETEEVGLPEVEVVNVEGQEGTVEEQEGQKTGN